jgi:lambda family phage portal protein
MAADGFVLPGSEGAPIYNAAGQGRRMRMYRSASVGPNAITISGQSTILARARAADRNDPWAGTAIDKLVSNEIGTGIRAKTKNGTPELKARAKKMWDRWTKYSDADGVCDFYGQQALLDRGARVAGEGFIRLRARRPQDGFEIPLQLQLIEAEQCPSNYYASASNGNLIRAGIEFNQIGQRAAYWMYPQHPGDVMATNFVSMQLRRIPAEQIIHVYQPLRPGQIRGLPHLTSVLVRMLNLDSFDDATLERQKIANLFSVIFTKSVAPDVDPLADAKNGEVAPDGTPLATLEPGSSLEAPAGYDAKFSDPPDAGPNYAPYLRTQLMAIAARAGVPYEVLTGDLTNVSDRALRLILNEFRRTVEQWQWLVLIPNALQKVREAWWDAAVLAGVLDAPGYAEDREDYVETIWTPQGWPYSHPVQDVQADRAAVRSGFKSRSSVIEANGDDPEEVNAQLVQDNATADANDMILDSDARYTSDRGITQAKPAGSVEPTTTNDPNAPADPNAPQQD